MNFNFLPERLNSPYRTQIEFEANLYRRFPKLVEYYQAILAKGIKVQNTSNSWVAWAIGITDDLPTGKMAVAKPTVPDIDLDFTNRDPIVDYIFEMYGEDHAAMVGAFQTIKTKNALKDIVRWQNGGHLPNDNPVHKLTKTIGNAPQYYPSEAAFLEGFTDADGKKHPSHLEENQALKDYFDFNPDVKDMLFKILEKPRAAGKHAGGMVITTDPIDTVIPTRYYDGRKCTQVDHHTLEDIGGMKIDILAVNTLNWVYGAIKLVQERFGITLDPWDLPHEPGAFKMLSELDVETVFQFDTATVKPYIKKIGPQSIHDLILITSVVRPGGLDSVMDDGKTVADHFVARYKGIEKVKYIDPILEPVLSDTYGLVVFQEQIQKIFEVVGGLTPTESDNARRAVGKKDLAVLLSVKGALFEGARKLGWDLPKCDELWESFEGAVNYAFNRAHACAYGVLAYACAYLKYKYPLEWWCSVLSYVEPDKIRDYLEIIKDKIEFPHVNTPSTLWTIVSDDKMRAPLNLVRNVGETAVQEIAKHAPFSTFEDFFTRIDKRKVNKAVIHNLLWAGCFKGLLPVDDVDAYITEYYRLRKEKTPVEMTGIDRIRKIRMRSEVLAISTFDCLKEFKDILESQKDFGSINTIPALRDCPIVGDFSKFTSLSRSWQKDVCIVGIVSSAEVFYYKNKRENKNDSALRINVTNNGRTTETVIWASSLEKLNKKDVSIGSLIAVFGALKYNNFKGEVILDFKGFRKLV